MKLTVFGVIASLALAGPTFAGGVLYDCTVKQTAGPRGWVSPRTAIVVDDSGAGQIIDSLTLQFETGPRPAQIRRQGDKLIITWAFEALTDRASQMIPKFSFRGTLDTSSGAFKVRGKPARFPQTVRGTGSCVVRQNLSTRQLNRLLRG